MSVVRRMFLLVIATSTVALGWAVPAAATFTAVGSFSASGWDVDPAGGTGFEVCTTATTCQAGDFGSGAGQLWGADGIGVDSSGNVYVTDTLNDRVSKFDSAGGFISAWGWDVDPAGGAGFEICTTTCKAGISGGGAGQLDSPRGITVDSSGNVYVTDSINDRVSKFDSAGNFLSAWGWGVDTGAAVLEVCTTASTCQTGSPGGAAGQLNNPRGVGVDSSGNVYVTDSSNDRVSKFDTFGNFISAWGWDVDPAGGAGFEVCTTITTCQSGVSGSGAGQFNFPQGIGVDSSGNVYVTEPNDSRVSKFDSAGNFLSAWGWDVDPAGGTGFEICTAICKKGVPGGGAGQLDGVAGAGVDSSGNVYVTDSGNQRVSKFDSAGNFLSAWGWGVDTGTAALEVCTTGSGCQPGSPGAAGQLDNPRGVGVDSSSNVYVTDSGNQRVSKFMVNLLGQSQVTLDNVGVGTLNPETSLHVLNDGATGLVQEVLRLEANVPPQQIFKNYTSGAEWFFAMTADDEFKISRNGTGVVEAKFFSDGDLNLRGDLSANSFITTSDEAAKTGFTTVDPGAVLEAVTGLEVGTWAFNSEPGITHMGPTAQNFAQAFGLGNDPTGIATVDADGVALAAIQALNTQTQELIAQNQELRLWVGLLTLLVGVLGLTTGVGYLRRRRHPTMT